MIAIGYDIGSSFIKAALINIESGKSIAIEKIPEVEIPIIADKIGWAEQDPLLWWKYLCQATQSLIKKAKIDSDQITSIGISYQMHGLVLVDKDLNALRNSIIWCDSRASLYGQKAMKNLGRSYCENHLLNSPGNFTASKLAWVVENEPSLYEKVYKFMLPGDFLAAKLTGEIQTTINGLSEGVFWDFKNDSLSESLFKNFKIDQSLVPEIVLNFEEQAKVSKKASELTGLPAGIPLTYRSGDQPNNAFTLGARNSGDVVATAGTSGVVYALTDKFSGNELTRVNTFAHLNYQSHKKTFGKLLNLNGAGIQYRWLNQLMGSLGYQKLNHMAKDVPVGSDGLMVFPFGNGAERMLDNKNLNGHISNINFNIHHNDHMVRATLEGIAFALIYGIEILKNDGVVIDKIKVGNDNLFLSDEFSKTIANALGVSIEMLEATGAEGAARASVYKHDIKTEEEKIKVTKTIRPNENLYEKYNWAYKNWKNQLTNNLI